MFGFGKYFAYLGVSSLSAIEICYLVLWISSSNFRVSDLFMIPLGAVWVPLVALPTWVLLAPVFWVALAISTLALAYIAVKRLNLTFAGVLICSIALAASTALAALIWFISSPSSTIHRSDIAMYFCLGGAICSLVFGFLSGRYLRKQRRRVAKDLPA
jgi:hypothetical protein